MPGSSPGMTSVFVRAFWLAGIIAGDKPNLAIAIAPNYIWIKETMEKLSGS
ncbi:MAG: hypothetical protein WBG16_04900 [Bradyrhizobium sp.]|jgi:hypothetical protein|uniref:hypothetical protein n=1 Tax=Bradyrhizobium sp. TaxID=376 RepID=UPI003C7620E3